MLVDGFDLRLSSCEFFIGFSLLIIGVFIKVFSGIFIERGKGFLGKYRY